MGNRPRIGLCHFGPEVQRFPRRGGNYNNGGNIDLGYENCNNPRSNTNRNYGARPAPGIIKSAARLRIGSRHLAREGPVSLRAQAR